LDAEDASALYATGASRPSLGTTQGAPARDDGRGVPAKRAGKGWIFVALHPEERLGKLVGGGETPEQRDSAGTPAERDQHTQSRALRQRGRGKEAVERLGHASERTSVLATQPTSKSGPIP
jgi:hypothetical protein